MSHRSKTGAAIADLQRPQCVLPWRRIYSVTTRINLQPVDAVLIRTFPQEYYLSSFGYSTKHLPGTPRGSWSRKWCPRPGHASCLCHSSCPGAAALSLVVRVCGKSRRRYAGAGMPHGCPLWGNNYAVVALCDVLGVVESEYRSWPQTGGEEIQVCDHELWIPSKPGIIPMFIRCMESQFCPSLSNHSVIFNSSIDVIRGAVKILYFLPISQSKPLDEAFPLQTWQPVSGKSPIIISSIWFRLQWHIHSSFGIFYLKS